MPASTNLQLNAWADTRVRPLCDELRHVYDVLVSYKTDYAAQGISALITADGTALFEGSQDSRQAITGTQVQNLKACLDQIQTAFDTTLVPGVGSIATATINAIQVNGALKS
jgi:hypothetical protein